MEPVTEPVKTLGVTKRSVGDASPGLNAEGVPAGGGERSSPRNGEREKGGGEKRIAAQDNRTSKPGKQEHRGREQRGSQVEAALARRGGGLPNPMEDQAPGEEGEDGGGFLEGDSEGEESRGEDEAMSERGGVVFALVMGEIGEEDASGDEGDDGGGLIGLSADDAGTGGPEECGDGEDGVKPVGGRGGGCAEDAGAGRQQSGPKSGEQKPGKEMKAEILPGTLAKRGNTKEDGTVEAEPAVKIGEARNGGIGLDPADGRSAVEAGVVILEGAAGAQSEEECKGEAEEEQPARVLPGGEEAGAQLGAD